MEELNKCPFCKGEAWLVVCDDEGNMHEDSYEDDPWSGLGYQLAHDISHIPEGQSCPIATFEYETLGTVIYDSRDAAVKAWNK